MKYRHTKGNEIDGHLEIRVIKDSVTEPIDETLSVHINGDRNGLKSLAEYLLYLAELNQEDVDDNLLPIGASEHGNLRPNIELSQTSNETILGRLDRKGKAELPAWYVSKTNTSS
jgi:hypothetical protein